MMAGDKTLHLPTIKPLAEISREVIDLALAADIDGARNALDKLRVMRCRLARPAWPSPTLCIAPARNSKPPAPGGKAIVRSCGRAVVRACMRVMESCHGVMD